MKIHTGQPESQPPYTVVVIDMTDAYYYADIFDSDRMKTMEVIDDLGKSKAVANAYFVIENHRWDSLQDMNNSDSGYDVRVYDKDFRCVYAAHMKFQDTWIGS